MAKITDKEIREKIKNINELIELESQQSNLNRARSITVGTAYSGGCLEISLRGNGDRQLWMILQPTEVVELINQLAAGVGCHIHVQPRDDFASWRHWDNTPQLGNMPASNYPLPPPSISTEKHQALGLNLRDDTKEKQDVVATKKDIDKRSVE